MILPPFSLPSEPSKKITLRESTVEECMDFAGVSRKREEQITTLFLNRLQGKAEFVDSATWTAQDRRFGVFWYWLHTVKDPLIPTSYDCEHCGKLHKYLADYRQIADSYQPMKGLPERDILFGDERLVVRPLNGSDMEALELGWLELDTLKQQYGEDSGEYGKRAAAIRAERLCRTLGWTSSEDEKRIKAMGVSKYCEMSELVENALEDMTHGLDSVVEEGKICLWLPPHQCPNITDREATTRLWVNFRYIDYLPEI